MGSLAIGLIRLYQRGLSPVLVACFGASCRFSPSCSEYAIGAIRKHGIVCGMAYTVWRIARCQPFSAGGYDPVP